jgi:molecular chaperone GrpE (heat shock protein)
MSSQSDEAKQASEKNCITEAQKTLISSINQNRSSMEAKLEEISKKYDELATKINQVLEKLQENKKKRNAREIELIKKLGQTDSK